MDYFYVKLEDVTSHGLTLRGDESKHLVRVLRKNIGDTIFVTDGNEMMYQAVIAEIGKTDTRCTIAAIHRKYNEPSIDVTLAVSLLKNPARFDYLVEKTTELGVRTILPVSCERTISHNEKHERLEKIALSAMKQCGRSWLPRIQPLQSFRSIVDNSSHYQLKFVLHEKTDFSHSIASELILHDDLHSLLIVVGPEGGFTEEEIAYASHAGFKSILLGTRRLRTETAAVVAVSHVLV
ncbi:MAG: RsmE family RNA methyltransferase [Ignavibacteriales bacterium]|nr:RsmE family RNA methyltransferase [Ignavibacteriales bacterium]